MSKSTNMPTSSNMDVNNYMIKQHEKYYKTLLVMRHSCFIDKPHKY